MKENFKDMLLESESGYMMPFALEEKEELPTTLGYGKQRHPMTGEEFNHLGVDFAIKNRDLYAVASGMIVGAGNDALHDNYIVAKYGKYEVTYGHLAEAYTGYGESVSAGDKIAKSGDFLHVGIRFNGQDIDPMVFLSMIWANIQQLAAMGIQKQPTEESLGTKNIKFRQGLCFHLDAHAQMASKLHERLKEQGLQSSSKGRSIPTQHLCPGSLQELFL